MYKTYFKQALALLRQNPFISIVSIAGTALAIMMVMTMFVIREVKSTNMKPEGKADRMLTVSYFMVSRTDENSNFGGGLYAEYGEMLYDLKVPEAVSLHSNARGDESMSPVTKEGSLETFYATVRHTDAAYWQIFDHQWISGRPYGQEEYEAGIPEAVITDRMAKEIFGNQEPLGRTISVTFRDYRITGVVKEVSPIFTHASADIWIPSTTQEVNYVQAVLLARDRNDFAAIEAEVRELEKKFAIESENQKLWLAGPQTKRVQSMNFYGWDIESYNDNLKAARRLRAATILMLLLIPAINLAGFSLARMNKRKAEIGIRKAFGAKRSVILIQVLYENLITSLVGGIIGLGLSYAAIYCFREWLLGIPAGSSLPVMSMLSFSVFLAVFLLCVALNLLSAGIPAYRASKMSIVNSLNRNEQQRW